MPISFVSQKDEVPASVDIPSWNPAAGRTFGQSLIPPGHELILDIGGSIGDFGAVNSCPIKEAPTCDLCGASRADPFRVFSLDEDNVMSCTNTYEEYSEGLLLNHGVDSVTSRKLALQRTSALLDQCLLASNEYAQDKLASDAGSLRTPNQSEPDFHRQITAAEISLKYRRTSIEQHSEATLKALTDGGDKWFSEVKLAWPTNSSCVWHDKIDLACRWPQIVVGFPSSWMKFNPGWTYDCPSPLNGGLESSCQTQATYDLTKRGPGWDAYNLCTAEFRITTNGNGKGRVSLGLLEPTKATFFLSSSGDAIVGGGDVAVSLDWVSVVPSAFTKEERDQIGCSVAPLKLSGSFGPPQTLCGDCNSLHQYMNPAVGAQVCGDPNGQKQIQPCVVVIQPEP